MKENKYVLCPICGKEKFYPKDYYIFCNHCGWEGSLDTSNIYLEEANGFSIRDYKKIYEEYIKIDPKFIWKDDKAALDKFIDTFTDYGSKCPVCGEDSFEADYRYCYKCGWKYNIVQAQYPDFEDSSNKLSLNQYKEKYDRTIKSNPNYMWKDTDEVKLPFNDKQLKWLNDNNINCNFNKLTPEKEIYGIIDSIREIQKKYETKEGYNTYIFIELIIDTILDYI